MRLFETVTGYGGDDIRHMHATDFFAEPEKQLIAERMAQVFASGHATVEVNLLTRGGDRIPYYFTGSCLVTAHGSQLIGTGVDIAARRWMEEMLRRSNQDLEAFAYVASHDLRQPLRMIRGYLHLLEHHSGAGIDQIARDYMAFAVDGAAWMDRLITDLLEYSRVGRGGVTMGEVDMGEVISQVLDLLKMAIAECRATVKVAGGDWPRVIADHGEMVRLMQNLIGNALKYRSPDRPACISLIFRRASPLWEFSVEDNGIGIEPSQFERIFGIFQRLHTADAYDGSGIGLAICKKSVEHYGGRIWVESRPGKGSTFFFELPGRT